MALGSPFQVCPASTDDTQCPAASFPGSHRQIQSNGLPRGFCAFSKSSDIVAREKWAHFLTWAQPATGLGLKQEPQALPHSSPRPCALRISCVISGHSL